MKSFQCIDWPGNCFTLNTAMGITFQVKKIICFTVIKRLFGCISRLLTRLYLNSIPCPLFQTLYVKVDFSILICGKSRCLKCNLLWKIQPFHQVYIYIIFIKRPIYGSLIKTSLCHVEIRNS